MRELLIRRSIEGWPALTAEDKFQAIIEAKRRYKDRVGTGKVIVLAALSFIALFAASIALPTYLGCSSSAIAGTMAISTLLYLLIADLVMAALVLRDLHEVHAEGDWRNLP